MDEQLTAQLAEMHSCFEQWRLEHETYVALRTRWGNWDPTTVIDLERKGLFWHCWWAGATRIEEHWYGWDSLMAFPTKADRDKFLRRR